MGIALELYTALNAAWDATIIAKPTWHYPSFDEMSSIAPVSRNQYLFVSNNGRLENDTLNGGDDIRSRQFTIIGAEGTEDDAEKAIRATKKVLHAASVTEGWYHIDTYEIFKTNNGVNYKLTGIETKMLAYDSW